MNNAGASTSLAAYSSVCDVCQGFGDLNNPRGYVLETKGNEWLRSRSVYTYVHHANMEVVIASAEAGCKLCELISQGSRGPDVEDVLDPRRPGSDGSEYSEDDAESSPTRDSAQPDPVVPVVQSGEDVLIASQLAELARRKGITKPADLDAHRDGRVILQVEPDGEYGPRGDKLHHNTIISLDSTSGLRGVLNCFNSPGISRSHEGMTQLSVSC